MIIICTANRDPAILEFVGKIQGFHTTDYLRLFHKRHKLLKGKMSSSTSQHALLFFFASENQFLQRDYTLLLCKHKFFANFDSMQFSISLLVWERYRVKKSWLIAIQHKWKAWMEMYIHSSLFLLETLFQRDDNLKKSNIPSDRVVFGATSINYWH